MVSFCQSCSSIVVSTKWTLTATDLYTPSLNHSTHHHHLHQSQSKKARISFLNHGNNIFCSYNYSGHYQSRPLSWTIQQVVHCRVSVHYKLASRKWTDWCGTSRSWQFLCHPVYRCPTISFSYRRITWSTIMAPFIHHQSRIF